MKRTTGAQGHDTMDPHSQQLQKSQHPTGESVKKRTEDVGGQGRGLSSHILCVHQEGTAVRPLPLDFAARSQGKQMKDGNKLQEKKELISKHPWIKEM